MPDISLETRQKSAAEEQEQSLLLKQQVELQTAKAADHFNALDSLHHNPAWKWFHSELLTAAVNETRDTALDVDSKTPAQREAAAHQHAFGLKLLGLLEAQRTFWANKAGIQI